MRIDVNLLRSINACSIQIEKFERWLGKRKFALLTNRNVQLALAYGLDIQWFCRKLVRHNDGNLTLLSKLNQACKVAIQCRMQHVKIRNSC